MEQPLRKGDYLKLKHLGSNFIYIKYIDYKLIKLEGPSPKLKLQEKRFGPKQNTNFALSK